MIDAQTTKPIRCEGCGFAFKFAESGEKCAVDCPACGDENAITHCLKFPCTETANSLLEIAPNGNVVYDEIMKCRAKNCPRLNNTCGGCTPSGTTGNSIIFVSKNIFGQKITNKDRRLILFLTVCVQIFILFGAAVYVLVDDRKADQTDHRLNHVTVQEHSSNVPVAPTPVPIKPISPFVNQVQEVTSLPASSQIQQSNTNVPAFPLPQTKSSVSKQSPSQPTIVTVKPKEKTATKIDAVKPVDKSEWDKNEVTEIETVKPKSDVFIDSLTAIPLKPTETASIVPEKDRFQNSVTNSVPINVLVDVPDQTHTEVPQKVDLETMLEKSTAFLASDPERSLKDALNVIKTFEQLGQSIPSVAYWMLGQAYASLSWGKMFLINSSPVENMTISSDSHWMLTQRQDNSVWIWDMFRDQSSRNGVQLDSGKIPYTKLLFSPDLRLIVGGRSDGMILIWDMMRQNMPETPVPLREKIAGLRDLQISPDGCWLAAFGGVSKSSSVAIRNNRYVHSIDSPYPIENVLLENGKYFRGLREPLPPYQIVRLRSMIQPPNRIENAKISNEIPLETPGKAILLEQSFPLHKNIQVSYLSEYSTTTQSGQGIEQQPIRVAIASETVAVLSEPNIVWLWDLRQIHNGFIPPPTILRGHDDEIRLMRFSPDSGKLAVGGKNSTTLVYDLHENKAEKIPTVLRGHRLDVTAIAFAPDGHWLATGSRDNTIRLWNLSHSRSNTTSDSVVLNGHLGWISSLIVNATGTKILSGSYDQTIRIWNVSPKAIESAAQQSPLVLQSNQGVVREIVLSPDEKKLISLGGDSSLRIRNIDGAIDDRHSITFRNRTLPISKVALTPNNRWLVFSYTNQRNPANSGVRLWPLNFDHLLQLVSE